MSRPTRGFLLLGAALLGLHLLLPRPALRPSTDALARYLDGESLGARPAPGTEGGFTGAPEGGARGGIFTVNDTVRGRFFGTYLPGDAWTGTLRGVPFLVDTPYLDLPVTGYPASAPNRLSLCVLGPGDDGETVIRRVDYAGNNPRESVALWEVDAREFRGARAYVELTDGLTTPAGWLGVGRPLLATRGGLGALGPSSLAADPGNYLYFAFAAAVVAALLFLPGLTWRAFRVDPPGGARGAAGLALPGLLGLGLFGLLLWLGGVGTVFPLGRLYVGALAVGALWAARWEKMRRGRRPGDGGAMGLALGIYGAFVLLALVYSVVPLTVDREAYPGTNQRGRMVCSPPDHATPYGTGVFFLYGRGGRDPRSDLYFGAGWNVGSRGPLVGLGTTALLNVFGLLPHDPPQSGEFAWPADGEGYFLARILGVLTNALVVPAVGALAARLAAGTGAARRAAAFALGWVALSPLAFLNTVYTWPKLLAATCALLAAEGVLAGGASAGAWRAGGLLALGYYAHPVGALLMPGVAMLRGGTTRRWDRRRSWLAVAAVVVVFVVCLVPWLAFKQRLDGEDRFARYPLGDGRGYATALSAGSWVQARVKSAFYTLAPAKFYFSDDTPDWFEAPLRGMARWDVAYAKGLPGHLGYTAFALAYAVLLGIGLRQAGRSRLTPGARALRLWGVWATLAGMVLVWGFNADGLGRNCLEGLSPFVLALTAAGAASAGWLERWRGLVPALFVGVTAETGWLVFSGYGRGQLTAGGPAIVLPLTGALAGILALALAGWCRASGSAKGAASP